MATVTGQLRAKIKASGETGYALAKRSGVSQATLSRFLRGAAIDGPTLDTLAALLGMELTVKAAKTGKTRKGR
jgi:transcriptional regulator with XRE-family HTH domain